MQPTTVNSRVGRRCFHLEQVLTLGRFLHPQQIRYLATLPLDQLGYLSHIILVSPSEVTSIWELLFVDGFQPEH